MNGAKWGREEGENTDTRQCSDRKTDKDRAAQEARMHAVTYSTVATGAAILAQYKFTSNLSIMSSLRNNPVAAHLKQASCLKRDQFNFVALVWTRTPRFLFISYISRAFLDEWSLCICILYLLYSARFLFRFDCFGDSTLHINMFDWPTRICLLPSKKHSTTKIMSQTGTNVNAIRHAF